VKIEPAIVCNKVGVSVGSHFAHLLLMEADRKADDRPAASAQAPQSGPRSSCQPLPAELRVPEYASESRLVEVEHQARLWHPVRPQPDPESVPARLKGPSCSLGPSWLTRS
jgi:hypothetical protein